MERRGPSHLGPYGKACASCFKAKCKCVAHPDGPGCQRCHRLNKVCQPSGLVRRQTVLNKQNAKAQISELSKKLDGLVERLGTHESPPSSSHRDHQVEPLANLEDVDQSLDTVTAEDEPQGICGDRDEENNEDISAVPWSPPGLGGQPTATSKGWWNSAPDAEIETTLGIFRMHMLYHFPFVHLPSQLTVHQLRRDRPFMLRAIICVASQRDKAAQGSELTRAMSEALIVEETDRVDLLLGLLIYLSWGWDHSRIMSRLTMQAMSLACEISNPKSQDSDAPIRTLFMPSVGMDASPSTSHFLEHQRAVLGCFVLSSAVSAYFNHVDTLRWTPQMDEGLAALSTNRECPTDAAFAVQVRLQLLGQRAMDIRRQQQTQQAYLQAPAGTASTPATVSLTTLQGELQDFRATLSVPETSRHLCSISATELIMNETRHAVNATVPFMISRFSAMTASSIADTSGPAKNGERSWCLWECMNAIKTYADSLLGLSASDFAGISFVQWSQLARNIVALNWLTVAIEDPSWDRAAARAIADMPLILGRVADSLELAAQVVREEQEPEGALTGLSRRMRELCSDLRGSAAREQKASQDMIARSKVFGGALGGGW